LLAAVPPPDKRVDDGTDRKYRSLFGNVHLTTGGDIRRRIFNARQAPLRSIIASAPPFSGRSAAAGHFSPRRSPKIRHLRAQNQPSNRAFRERWNRALETLKKGKKSPFIQQLADRDIALGAIPLSWHK
jgi:hypothetical protein